MQAFPVVVNNHHCKLMDWEMKVMMTLFLTLVLDGWYSFSSVSGPITTFNIGNDAGWELDLFWKKLRRKKLPILLKIKF